MTRVLQQFLTLVIIQKAYRTEDFSSIKFRNERGWQVYDTPTQAVIGRLPSAT